MTACAIRTRRSRAGRRRRATGTHVVGPIAAVPVGIDIVGRPFDEPRLLLIAAAYECATKHRSPPADFPAPLGEP